MTFEFTFALASLGLLLTEKGLLLWDVFYRKCGLESPTQVAPAGTLGEERGVEVLGEESGAEERAGTPI